MTASRFASKVHRGADKGLAASLSHKQLFRRWELSGTEICLCLICLVLFLLSACSDKTDELKKTLQPSRFDVIEDNHVRLTTEYETYKTDATDLILYVENVSDTYGVIGTNTVPFYIEIELDGEWYLAGPEEDGPWAGLGVSIRSGGKVPIEIDLDYARFDWVKGHYRVVIPVSVVSRKYYAAEFDME